jgi:hypothetical protein
MPSRFCPFCQQSFLPSRFHPQQRVCSAPACQHQRRQQNRQQKLLKDPEYRQVCRDSARQWRDNHPDYWKQYRASHPQSVQRNRVQQRQRDLHGRLVQLANNNSALPLKSFPAQVWLQGPAAGDLANNNLASAHVLVLQTLVRPAPLPPSACKQQLSGPPAALA